MAVAFLTLDLHIPHSGSLKDRRQVVRSLKDRLRHGFNVSVAEIDEAVSWRSASIGVAAVSRSRSYLAGLMQQVEEASLRIARGLGAEVTDSSWTFLEDNAEDNAEDKAEDQAEEP